MNPMVRNPLSGMGQITIADVNQSNGVIHVVNGVILPK